MKVCANCPAQRVAWLYTLYVGVEREHAVILWVHPGAAGPFGPPELQNYLQEHLVGDPLESSVLPCLPTMPLCDVYVACHPNEM